MPLSKSIWHNEKPKLDRSWIEESMSDAKASVGFEASQTTIGLFYGDEVK